MKNEKLYSRLSNKELGKTEGFRTKSRISRIIIEDIENYKYEHNLKKIKSNNYWNKESKYWRDNLFCEKLGIKLKDGSNNINYYRTLEFIIDYYNDLIDKRKFDIINYYNNNLLFSFDFILNNTIKEKNITKFLLKTLKTLKNTLQNIYFCGNYFYFSWYHIKKYKFNYFPSSLKYLRIDNFRDKYKNKKYKYTSIINNFPNKLKNLCIFYNNGDDNRKLNFSRIPLKTTLTIISYNENLNNVNNILAIKTRKLIAIFEVSIETKNKYISTIIEKNAFNILTITKTKI